MLHSIRLRYKVASLLGASLLPVQAFAQGPEPDAGLLPSPELSSEVLATAPPSEVPGDCGLSDDVVPDFELVDLNTASATYEQAYTLDTFASEVLVIYWALAS